MDNNSIFDINEIASKHLGRAGDGTVVNPYTTPDEIDNGLLVGVPRILNRTIYDIGDDLPFYGVDSWNCYEFSCLLCNGYPVSGLMRINYNANSKNIVESKSLKLYLNSFNMVKMGKTLEESVSNVEAQVQSDLKPVLQTDEIDVKLHIESDMECQPINKSEEFVRIENVVDFENVEFSQYNETPETLVHNETADANNTLKMFTSVLRSNCRVTNQPDWGDVYIHIKGGEHPTAESLLQYIVSMRKENHFHEEIAECIYKRLYDVYNPQELVVACLYTRRGGIDINPIRANKSHLLYENPITKASNLCKKTLRQ